MGVGPGVGYNFNVPLDFGVGDSGYMRAFDALVVPAVDAFKPTFVVVACGVDGSQMDPNGRQLLTTKGFFELGRACRKLADKHASSRIVSTLEGGYHVSYAALCVHAVLAVRVGSRHRGVLVSHAPNIAGLGWTAVPRDRRPAGWHLPRPAVARPNKLTHRRADQPAEGGARCSAGGGGLSFRPSRQMVTHLSHLRSLPTGFWSAGLLTAVRAAPGFAPSASWPRSSTHPSCRSSRCRLQRRRRSRRRRRLRQSRRPRPGACAMARALRLGHRVQRVCGRGTRARTFGQQSCAPRVLRGCVLLARQLHMQCSVQRRTPQRELTAPRLALLTGPRQMRLRTAPPTTS